MTVASLEFPGRLTTKTILGERIHCSVGGAGAVTISRGAHNSNQRGSSWKDA